MRLHHSWWLCPAAAVFALSFDACGPVEKVNNALGNDPTCSTTTFSVENHTFATFGTSADGRKIDAFLQATNDLDFAVDRIHDGTLASCTAIGTDLGIAPSEYVSVGAEPRVATVCRRVIAEVRTILQASLPARGALRVDVSPAVCRVDLNLVAQCAGRCDVSASAMVPRCMGTVVADCAGSCDATCSGTCAAGCTGQCTGTCSGTCSGTCAGECAGTCSAMDATGRCIGTCSGTCNGSCSAGCTGSCTGTCTAGCMGACTGQCRGTCSVASNVRCDGTWDVQASAQCQAACRAQASAHVECTDPQVSITATATASPASVARLRTLVTSLQRNYPGIVKNGELIRATLADAVPAFAASLQGAAQAAGNVSATASACIVRAVAATADTQVKFQASVQVSVDFTAAVSTMGTAQ